MNASINSLTLNLLGGTEGDRHLAKLLPPSFSRCSVICLSSNHGEPLWCSNSAVNNTGSSIACPRMPASTHRCVCLWRAVFKCTVEKSHVIPKVGCPSYKWDSRCVKCFLSAFPLDATEEWRICPLVLHVKHIQSPYCTLSMMSTSWMGLRCCSSWSPPVFHGIVHPASQTQKMRCT